MADRFYADKVLDFAMEFFISEDHTVEFLGYSVFHAAESGAYGYNYVESQQELLQRIGADEALLQRLQALPLTIAAKPDASWQEYTGMIARCAMQ